MSKRNILTDIEKLIFPKKEDDNLWIRDDFSLKKSISNFVGEPNRTNAQALYTCIKTFHEKDTIFSLVDDLLLYETALAKLIPEQRDHYLHSVSVYLLGLGIYNSNADIRSALKKDESALEAESKKSFLFRWSLAACLHDVAYPLELTLKSFNKYSSKLHLDKNRSSFATIKKDLYQNFNMLPIIEPQDAYSGLKKDTALGLISNQLANRPDAVLSYNTLLNFITTELELMLSKGRIDHGMFSAIILLNKAHNLYKTNHWPIDEFYSEVVDAATAIFLHNFYRFSNLKEWF